MKRVDVLTIDPQWDFCNPGTGVQDPERGSLYVPGAEKDMERLSSMITRFGSKIKHIHVTLDCHFLISVAHPGMWRDSSGKHPAPFTMISHDDVKNGKWTPVYPHLRQWFTTYTEDLAKQGKYQLIIWPPHCLIGTRGNSILPVLNDALMDWQMQKINNVNFVSKGSNPYTEHYSGVKAEVSHPMDPSTQLNTQLIETLKEADTILLAGEALSHCVKSTVEDIANGFGDDTYVKKMVLLEDASSSVISPFVDFPAIAKQFVNSMVKRGMGLAKTTDF